MLNVEFKAKAKICNVCKYLKQHYPQDAFK